MVLFGLTFQPSGIKVKDTFDAIKMLDKVTPEMKKLGEGAIPYDGGLYPVKIQIRQKIYTNKIIFYFFINYFILFLFY